MNLSNACPDHTVPSVKEQCDLDLQAIIASRHDENILFNTIIILLLLNIQVTFSFKGIMQ